MKKNPGPAWLPPALSYVGDWLGFQLERYRQVGCTVAIAHGQQLVLESAFGSADLRKGQPLTPRHRMRIASHSKSFTAAGVMLLREQGKLGLDDPVGRYVPGLHKDVGAARIGELLSHGAGITRDGDDAGQFLDRRPYLTRGELLEALARKQPVAAGMRLKYSNHGYALLGLLIEQVGGSDYADWMMRNIVAPAGLRDTVPDMPLLARGTPMARGHSAEFPFGKRLVVPGDGTCDGMAAAAGFAATAGDVARFFAQLAPDAPTSVLSPASRREMMHRRWRDTHAALESHYGYGTMMGAPGAREWFGHTGSLQGFVSRTARFPALDCTVTVLCNAQDGMSWPWVDGIASILSAFKEHGAPTARVAPWRGRWWSLWGASDLVPMGKVVCQVAPAMNPPFDGFPTELAVTGKDSGIVQKASGYQSPGQAVRLVRGARGKPTALWVGGSELVTREAMMDEATGRYQAVKRHG